MDTFTDSAAFAGGVFLLPILMQIIKSIFPIGSWTEFPPRLILPTLLLMAIGWGALLAASDRTRLDFDAPSFIISAVVTALGASGVNSQVKTYAAPKNSPGDQPPIT